MLLQSEPPRLLAPLMNQVARILSAGEHGDPGASAQLLPLVNDELRKLAARQLAHETPERREILPRRTSRLILKNKISSGTTRAGSSN
jgi:hypothetical protein